MKRPRSRQRLLECVILGLALSSAGGRAEPNPETGLVTLPFAIAKSMENTPIVFKGQPLLLLNHRDDTKNKSDGYVKSMYLHAIDLATGERVATFGEGHSFVSGFVDGDRLHVFASQGSNFDWFQSLYHFSTTDLKTWNRELAIPREGDEHLFNCSICRDDKGFLMAYESNQPVQFCFRFARSKDLTTWTRVPNSTFRGAGDEYSACPAIRYFAPFYYVIYLHAPLPGRNGFLSFAARSKDLVKWDLSPLNPILEAGPGEGINNSDVDLFELEGKTYVVYATGDQATWGSTRMAMYPGPARQMFERWFPGNSKLVSVSAKSP